MSRTDGGRRGAVAANQLMSGAQRAVLWGLGAAIIALFVTVAVLTLDSDDPVGPVVASGPGTLPPITAAPTTVAPTTTAATVTTPPSTLAPTTTAAPTTTTTSLAAGEPLVLIPGGFQSVPFGLEPDVAIGRVARSFGEPTDDTGWIPSADLGPCPGDEIRVVSWGELSLLFADDITPFAAPGARQFISWIYTGPATPDDEGLVTGEGIGLGTDRASLDAAYGERLAVTSDEIFGTSFTVDFDPTADDWIYLSGALTGEEPGAVVIGLAGGRGCGE